MCAPNLLTLPVEPGGVYVLRFSIQVPTLGITLPFLAILLMFLLTPRHVGQAQVAVDLLVEESTSKNEAASWTELQRARQQVDDCCVAAKIGQRCCNIRFHFWHKWKMMSSWKKQQVFQFQDTIWVKGSWTWNPFIARCSNPKHQATCLWSCSTYTKHVYVWVAIRTVSSIQ